MRQLDWERERDDELARSYPAQEVKKYLPLKNHRWPGVARHYCTLDTKYYGTSNLVREIIETGVTTRVKRGPSWQMEALAVKLHFTMTLEEADAVLMEELL